KICNDNQFRVHTRSPCSTRHVQSSTFRQICHGGFREHTNIFPSKSPRLPSKLSCRMKQSAKSVSKWKIILMWLIFLGNIIFWTSFVLWRHRGETEPAAATTPGRDILRALAMLGRTSMSRADVIAGD